MGILNRVMGAALGLVLAGATAASAQDWEPDGALTMQIGFGAGGTTDTMGRVLVDQMREATGWNIIAENVTGGGGVAMFTGIARRPASNDVVGLGVNMPILINLVTRGDELAFDLDSFAYLGTMARAQLALVASADAPFDTLGEFVTYAQENPGTAVGFDAPPQRFLMNAVGRETGAEFNLVTLESSADAVRFLLGGQIMVAFSAGTHLPYLDSGELKVIGSANAQRLSYAPDAPTFRDLGYELYVDPYYFFAMHADSDPAAVEAIAAAIDAALQTEAMAEVVQNINSSPPENLGPAGTEEMFDASLEVFSSIFAK